MSYEEGQAMSDAPTMTDMMVAPESWDVCADCGEPVYTGSWPFCASRVNPKGHAKGAYGWRMASGMAKWNKVGRDGR